MKAKCRCHTFFHRIILDVDDLESGIFSIHVTFKENTGALVHEQKFYQSTTVSVVCLQRT